jgi:dihydroneopterin aldolase
MVGLAGSLEEPDVPRLLQLAPDFLGFRDALFNEVGAIDRRHVERIRRLVPPEEGEVLESDRARPASIAEPSLGAETVLQRIFVRDLVLPVRIGAYADERTAPQKVRFDVSVELDPDVIAPSEMGQVVSYDIITDGIAAIVAEGHIDFVETLAERIAAHALRQPRARRVTVKVEKIERAPAVVGVEIVAQRTASPEER